MSLVVLQVVAAALLVAVGVPLLVKKTLDCLFS